MIASGLGRKIAIALAIAALSVAVAGCASHVGVPTTEKSGSSKLRYYGGPKSPMWSSQ
ncbi:hypothetical protein [Bradyrhizobium sp.]|jgi:hypothetical protein|uniref:hypothetical protein n=1 Tax=Bradyrhizobium sp. TaxID=376 RepID=UPI003C1B16D1